MKVVNIMLEDAEHQLHKERKGGKSWKEYFLGTDEGKE